MKLGKHVSEPWTFRTRSPQCCVIASLLFSQCTNICTCTSSHQPVKVVKFAEDTTFSGLISDGCKSASAPLHHLVTRCSLNCGDDCELQGEPIPTQAHHPEGTLTLGHLYRDQVHLTRHVHLSKKSRLFNECMVHFLCTGTVEGGVLQQFKCTLRAQQRMYFLRQFNLLVTILLCRRHHRVPPNLLPLNLISCSHC